MQKTLKYFLAANSCEGFISHFTDCYNPKDGWKAYIIKGGPGTGKSSFMRRIALAAQNKNEPCVLCPCSSDPQSLDAVILHKRKTVIMDGTAPHTLDPRYPAVCEEILNFGQFWDTDKTKDNNQIIEITDRNKALHQTAQKYLMAVGQIILDTYKTTLACTKKVETKNFATRLCKKHIPQKSGTPYEWQAFLGGTTPEGIITYPETILNSCQNSVIISDRHRACSNIIINEVRNHCLINGYEIITLKNPLLPTLITDHIVIPALSLAFVTEDDTCTFATNTRRIHARRFTSNKSLHNYIPRLKLNRKVTKSLLYAATDTLKKAKSVHDQLESFYINAMDFNALGDFTDKFTQKLFT